MIHMAGLLLSTKASAILKLLTGPNQQFLCIMSLKTLDNFILGYFSKIISLEFRVALTTNFASSVYCGFDPALL